MPKVDYADLESVTKFLDKLSYELEIGIEPGIWSKKTISKAKELSKMIKDKYTEIKPDYDRTD
jgi:hypothetical protein